MGFLEHMILQCEECGEEQDFNKRTEGTKVEAVNEKGEHQILVEFEADGPVTYECAICRAEVEPSE